MKSNQKFSNIVVAAVLLLITGSAQMVKAKKFNPNLGVCTRITNHKIIEESGYQFIEEGVRKFLIPTRSEDEFAKKMEELKASNIKIEACNSFLSGSLKSVGEDANHEGILEFSEIAFRRAKQAGISIIVFGSGGSRRIPEGFSREEARKQFVELGKKLAPIAKKYDVTIVLEPLNSEECNFINSVSEGGEIVKDINHKNFQLLADIYHMTKDDEGPESIIKYGRYLKHVHIAEKIDRAAPGTGGEDFTAYFNALKEVKYKGRISVECRWKDMEEQAEIAYKTIINQFKK